MIIIIVKQIKLMTRAMGLLETNFCNHDLQLISTVYIYAKGTTYDVGRSQIELRHAGAH